MFNIKQISVGWVFFVLLKSQTIAMERVNRQVSNINLKKNYNRSVKRRESDIGRILNNADKQRYSIKKSDNAKDSINTKNKSESGTLVKLWEYLGNMFYKGKPNIKTSD